MKIAIIGAGSTYTPELIEGIINRADSLDIEDIFLYDINDRKLGIVGNFSKRMLASSGVSCNIVLSMDLDETLKDADFVLCQIRVGQMQARIFDEKIPLKHGLLGQETVGMGGLFKALRTIPVMLDIAHKMEKLCPNATMVNFTNPAGIVTQAINDHSGIRIYGVCNNPFNMKKSITERMNLNNPTFDYIGLNHLSFITGIYENGKNYISEALAKGINSENMKNIPTGEFDAELISSIEAIPSSYLRYVYKCKESLELAKKAEKTRGEKALEIEENLMVLYSDENLVQKPEMLSQRGGANYSLVAIELVDAIYNDKKEEHVVNLPNSEAFKFLDNSDVVETTAIIGKNTAEIQPINHINLHITGLMQIFKTYENFVVKAAVNKSKEAAICAMLSNPTIFDYDAGLACFEELFEVNKQYISLG